MRFTRYVPYRDPRGILLNHRIHMVLPLRHELQNPNPFKVELLQ
jgi:hypothetical protein